MIPGILDQKYFESFERRLIKTQTPTTKKKKVEMSREVRSFFVGRRERDRERFFGAQLLRQRL